MESMAMISPANLKVETAMFPCDSGVCWCGDPDVTVRQSVRQSVSQSVSRPLTCTSSHHTQTTHTNQARTKDCCDREVTPASAKICGE